MALEQNQTDRWNRIEGPGMNPHRYSHLTFDKGVKNICSKKRVYSTNSVGNTGYPPIEELTRFLYLTLYKINSIWIKALNVRFETTMEKHKENTGIYRLGHLLSK
jgi:hypothetical protein